MKMAMPAEPQLKLYLMGSFRLERDGSPVSLARRKTQSLLAYLALYPEEHSREKLATLLWGEFPDADAFHSLRTALSELRRACGDTLLGASRTTIQLNPDFPLWVDAREFMISGTSPPLGTSFGLMISGGATDMDHSEISNRVAVFGLQGEQQNLVSYPKQASQISRIDLYRGELLADSYDDWVLPLREQYRQLYHDTLLELTAGFRREGEYERSIQTAQQLVAADPANEQAHQHLMFCFAMVGNRQAALAQYQKCVVALREEIGVEVSTETQTLYDWIKQSRVERAAPGARQTNLPVPVSRFIGRESEIADLKLLVLPDAQVRLLTLTGAGGSGKTRLAIQVGTEIQQQFADGVWWLELAPLNDAALLPQVVARALGIREQAERSPMETLTRWLRDRRLALVLDNCEHLASECARFVSTILTACPGVTVITTSREPLGIMGEVIWQVPPLAVPAAFSALPLQQLRSYDAIQLFVTRAEAVNRHFRLTSQNSRAVVEICRRLDGIPLALELAAARMRMLSVEQIAERLDNRLSLLTLGDRTALARHQTLRAAMDWSYDLLPAAERALFLRLAVFAGDFSLEAVEVVCGFEPIEPRHTLDLLTRLVDKSLVVLRSFEPPRYAMFQTFQEYALEHLKSEGILDQLRARHRDYYFRLAAQAAGHFGRPEEWRWTDRMEQEFSDLRAALAWTVESGATDLALRAVLDLWGLWLPRGYVVEANDWISRLLVLEKVQKDLKFAALGIAEMLARYRNDYDRVQEYLDQMRIIAEQDGSIGELAVVHRESALMARERGDYGEAIDLLEEARRLDREAGAYAGSVSLDYYRLQAIELTLWLADTMMRSGKLARAGELWEEGAAAARERGDPFHLGWALGGLADQALFEGQPDRAAALSRESLALKQEFQDRDGISYSWETLANAAAAQGQLIRAAMLWGASERYREVIHIAAPSVYQADYEVRIADARAQLGTDKFAEAWRSGRELSFEQTMDLALSPA